MRWRSLALLLCVLPFGQAAYAQGNLTKTQAELAKTRAKANALSQELRASERELSTLRQDATKVARAIQQSEASLTASERKLAQLSREIAESEERLVAREAEMQRAMLAMLAIERMPPAAVFAQPGNAQETIRTAAALDVARSALEADASALHHELSRLKASRAELARTKEKARKDAESLAAKRSTLTTQLTKRAKLQANLSTHYQSAEADAKRLAREASNLQQLISGLDRSPSTTAPAGVPERGTPTRPVSGNVLHRYGEKNGNDTWRGMMFRTRPSALVVAPAGGEVAFTGPFMNYGSMVLLRHQGGTMSLMAGFGRIDVRLKEKIRAGEPLGIMPATGEQNLYVELRENSKPIDPARWFATVSSSLAH